MPNFTSIKTIKKLLNRRNLKPLKKLGQNFLISPSVVDKAVSAAELKPSDIVLEVGPGLGALTTKIAEKVKQVIAIEKDKGLTNILKELLKEQKINNVEVISADILKYKLPTTNYKLISNLPYNIATAIIMQFLEAKNPPETMLIMLQKEVGQRICAKPPHMNKLAVFSQFYSTPKIISYVSKGNFEPQPNVDSAILKITPHNKYKNKVNEKLFTRIVKAGFANPRKQLVNNLSKGLSLKKQQIEHWLKQNKIAPTQRAETLSLNNWLGLANTYPHQP